APPGTNRKLYFFRGSSLKISGYELSAGSAAQVQADLPALLENGATEGEVLMLQGRPIGEPIVQSGPFVMNTRAEIQQAYTDFRAAFAAEARGPIHEPMCGSGRFLLPLLAQGHDISGSDSSASMLDACRARGESLGLIPRLTRQPLAELSCSPAPALIFIPSG